MISSKQYQGTPLLEQKFQLWPGTPSQPAEKKLNCFPMEEQIKKIVIQVLPKC
ncbi:hypothetical protein ES705_15670 [subsurface metagenome]